jgi:hypothetical protein
MMPPKRDQFARVIASWAGFTPRGDLAYATIRPTQEAAQAEADRLSPPVEGFPPPLRILPVFIGLDLNNQQTFDFSAEDGR